MSQRVVFEVPKVEQLVLENRAADRGAQTVVVVARKRTLPRQNIQLIYRVKLPVLKVLVNRSVKLVGTGLYDHIEHAPGGRAELGAELVLHHVKLADGFVRDINLRAGAVMVVVHYAVQVETVVFRTLTGDAGARALTDSAGGSDARTQEAQIIDASPVDHFGIGGHGHVFSEPGVKRTLQLRRRGVDRSARFLDFHHCADGAHR